MKMILSLDGGGIRGIIPAIVLSWIEKETKTPIYKLFDLIAGTSTGGILALGLSAQSATGLAKYSAADLCDIHTKRGHKIFSKTLWHSITTIGGITKAAYSQSTLKRSDWAAH